MSVNPDGDGRGPYPDLLSDEDCDNIFAGSRESTPGDEEDEEKYHSASNSNENLFQALQIFILRQNARLLRRLSLQASIATKDLSTFKQWIYQDYEQHRSQLREAGANLFFRNESKDDIHCYDIVITFDRRTDPLLVGEVQTALQLAHPTFTVQHRKHYFANYTEQALYVSATDEFFSAYMPLLGTSTSEDDEEAAEDKDDGCSAGFTNSTRHQKLPQECSSLQRQTILHDILKQWRFELLKEDEVDEEDDESAATSFPRLRKCLNSNKGYDVDAVNEDACTIDLLMQYKVISQIFPLHYDEALSSLKKEWVYQFLSAQPLDNICQYFGIQIAIYFAWIGYYSKMLLYPSLFGLFITYFPYLMQLCHSNDSVWLHWCTWLFVFDEDLLNDVLQFSFTIFNMFWSSIFLQKWDQRCRQHVASWSRLTLPIEFALCGKLNSSGRRSNHPQSPSGSSGDNGRLSRIIFKYCVTFPALGCSLAITFAIMFQIFHFQTWWDSALIEKQAYPSWTRFVPKILLAIIINGSNCIYYLIAQWLNDREKYANAESKENNLIIKLVLFQFLNSFLPLFYIAFYIVDVEKLKEQLAAQLITRQVIGNFNEAVWPFLKESYRIATRRMQRSDQRAKGTHSDGVGEKKQKEEESEGDKMGDVVTKGELESCMFQYESTFDDYLELVIQFGYVMLFAPVFPLAALCALTNNILEIRSDAFKLCFVFQRPFAADSADQTRSIGEWANVLYYLSIVAIPTNCALMAVTGQISRVFGFTSSAHIETLLTSVAIEHALLLMKWLIPNLLI